MATVHLVLARTNARADTGSTLPIPDPVPVAAETITTDGTNKVATTVVADGAAFGSWSITVTGGPIWVAIGPAPDTTQASKRWLMLDGETRSFGAQSGHKVSMRDFS